MYYVYILYSESADKYYVGYTSDINLRLKQHNEQMSFNTFTAQYRPWKIAALFSCGDDKSTANKLERFIKKQHSRKLLEKLINPNFKPTGFLDQLVRVPHVRD